MALNANGNGDFMRALVLGGGAVKGAYELGAIKYLIKDLGKQYDIICGVSVGALNGSHLAMYSKEEQYKGVDYLSTVWDTINNDKVRKDWFPFGVVSGLWKESIYNSQPLMDLVRKNLDLETIRKNGVQVAVGAVSITTGNYKCFTQLDDSFIDGVIASSADPIGLCPIMIDGELWSDGGLKHIVPIQAAIDLGAEDLDIVMCHPKQNTSTYTKSWGIKGFGLRCLDLMTDQIEDSDVKLTLLYNKLVNAGLAPDKKYLNVKIIRPEKNLECSALEFDHEAIEKMIAQGYEDAKSQYCI